MIRLTDDYAKRHMARAIPSAYFDPGEKAWVLADPTPRTAAVALKIFPELAAEHHDLVELRELLNQDVRPFDKATPFGQTVGAGRVRYELKQHGKDLYEFQAVDCGYLTAVLKRHGAGYLGWERGLGKTLGAAAIIDELDCQQTLVVAPNTAKESVWAAELRRWCPWLTVIVLPNEQTKRARALNRVLQLRADEEPFVLIVHYEALAIIAGRKPGKRSAQLLGGWDKYGRWDLVVADEAHRLWNVKTQMCRAIKKIPSRRRLALSGSIVMNHAEELFGPLSWLFPDQYRSKWRDWNDRYLDYVEGGFSKICVGVKLDRLEEMREELGVFMTYRRKEDELDLPDKTEETLLVDLSESQRSAYNSLLTTCIAELDNGERVKAADGLVMLTRLRQLASGIDLLTDEIKDSSKLDLAVDLISDNPDEAFVVFNWYKASARSLQERLEAKGIGTFLVDGDVPQHKRADLIAQFQEGYGQVFIGTISTLGESVTLHRATNAIFIDRSWNPGQNTQAEDRIYRIGQDKPVTITHIIARDTVDEFRVQPVLATKEALRRAILGGR